MTSLSRRSVLRGSLALAAAGTLARPYVANAQAKTATMWWTQGFVPQEDSTIQKIVAEYQKASGNKMDLSIVPFAPLRQKTISALTSGTVPDLIESSAIQINAQEAWDDKFEDVTDVVETQKSEYMPNALASAHLYNSVTKKRSYYGVPINVAVVPFHVWSSLVEKAGFKNSDTPKTWTKFLDFFKPMQKPLQAAGLRHTYSYGWEVSTVGDDPTNTFHAFMIAYGGEGIVTPDGKLHSKDPKVKEAAIKALERLVADFKEGYVPKEVVNWNDADDNNAFHSKLCVVDFDGTLSTEVAMLNTDKDAYYHDVITYPLPLNDEGKQMPSQLFANTGMIPKGAKNIAVAKEFLKYLIEPKVNNEWTKGGLGRWMTPFPSTYKTDAWWTDLKQDPHRPPYVKQGIFSPTIPFYYTYNPAYAQVMTEHTWNVAWSDIVTGGMKPEAAVDKALKRIEAIFAKYPIQQA
jgi:multiple sugar transport system substrate-binding protein